MTLIIIIKDGYNDSDNEMYDRDRKRKEKKKLATPMSLTLP
jgi:hypothetical protein